MNRKELLAVPKRKNGKELRGVAGVYVIPSGKMHELGYEPLPEKEDGQGKWCFKPKTYFLEPVSDSYKLAEEGE